MSLLIALIRSTSLWPTLSAPTSNGMPRWYCFALETLMLRWPFFAAFVSAAFIGTGSPLLTFFSSIVNGRTDCS